MMTLYSCWNWATKSAAIIWIPVLSALSVRDIESDLKTLLQARELQTAVRSPHVLEGLITLAVAA
jgi:hypothetical protein